MAQLVADSTGKINGKFRIPAGIPAGSKSVTFTGSGGGRGEAIFVGQGKLTTKTMQKITTVRRTYRYDPLAQTFTLERAVQLAGVDLWFTAKQTEVRIQLREVANGVPDMTVLAEAVVAPEQIVVTGGGHTRILFPAPVFLSAGTEYAFVVLCDDPVTKLSIAELGKFDSFRQQWVTSQAYAVGVLLSSSNASTWTPHQDRDLAFRLLEASFSPTTKTLDLGSTELASATDVLLLSLAEIPSAQARVEYELGLPDGTNMTVAADQPVRLSTPTSGVVTVKAHLTGETSASPVLYPGSQILSGKVAQTADYYTRSVVAKDATKAVLVYDAIIPSGSNVTPELQIDSGEWESLDADGATPGDDGVVEYRFRKNLSGAQLIKVRLTLTGTSTARPVVRNIRLMAAM